MLKIGDTVVRKKEHRNQSWKQKCDIRRIPYDEKLTVNFVDFVNGTVGLVGMDRWAIEYFETRNKIEYFKRRLME